MDLQVGAILKELEADGLADSTIVFFFSDHGRGLPRGKRWLYDSGIHVPLMIRWPDGRGAGTTSDQLISMIDVGPTLLSLAGVQVPDYMQGRPFLGDQKAPPREYIFAARDRMDETYDIIRTVRDRRYKYIRNLQPAKPYAQYIAYMEEMPTMQEWRRLYKRRELTGPQRLFFLPEKPPEELYDTVADPHEVNNLAGSAEHREVLERMRRQLDDWMVETKDLGLIPEDMLQERMRPGGEWQTTATPVIEPSKDGQTGVVRVAIRCETPGASIAYTTQPEGVRRPHWQLYSGPIVIRESCTLRARAVRLGYRESQEARAAIRVK